MDKTQVHDADDIDVVMPVYNLKEFSDYSDSKASEILWQYCRDEPDLDVNYAITDFNAANTIINSIKIKEKINRSNKQRCYKKC